MNECMTHRMESDNAQVMYMDRIRSLVHEQDQVLEQVQVSDRKGHVLIDRLEQERMIERMKEGMTEDQEQDAGPEERSPPK